MFYAKRPSGAKPAGEALGGLGGGLGQGRRASGPRGTPSKTTAAACCCPASASPWNPWPLACTRSACRPPASPCIIWWPKLPRAMRPCGRRCAPKCCPRGGVGNRLWPGSWMRRPSPRKGDIRWGRRASTVGSWASRRTVRGAVTLSVATGQASLPVAWRLDLVREWAEDPARRKKAGGARGGEVSDQARDRAGSDSPSAGLGLAAGWCWPMPATARTRAFAKA
jgi:hypothetical protein